jgi:hypothetical protein
MHGIVLGLDIHGLRHTKIRLPDTRSLVAAADIFVQFGCSSAHWSIGLFFSQGDINVLWRHTVRGPSNKTYIIITL